MVDLDREEHELLARVARRWYVDRRTQGEIAAEFGLSRPKVQRLLDRARATGVVEVHIEVPMGMDLDLEHRFVDLFGLKAAIVSPSVPDPDEQRVLVARRAARYLEQLVGDGSVVAVSHGRDIGAVPRQFRPIGPIDCVFASAMGGSPRVDAPTNPNETCRSMAERSGGRAESLYAPAYVESAEVRDRLLEQDAVAHALKVAAGADVALVGMGGTDDACTMVRSGCLTRAEIRSLRRQGAVGDVLGNYVDIDGEHIVAPHSHRLIGLSIDDLRGIPTVVAVVSGDEKPRAILGVLRAGIVDVLILDESNAQTVLDLAQTGDN
ncbi:MAG TPA: sugar-binding transcriptional regulator [Nocardioidaceae bacterium]|jgi:DNA-binding transcriptional regulator LsrR (DeoR family)